MLGPIGKMLKRVPWRGVLTFIVVVAAAGGLHLVNSWRTRDARQEAGPDWLATITTSQGDIRVRLLTSKAPSTVAHFVRLVREKRYDGVTSFHFVDKNGGYIVGGQLPEDREPKESVPLEESGIEFTPGTLAMWHPQGEQDANRSAFVIFIDAAPGANTMYSGFGKVLSGFDVLDRIRNTPTTAAGVPLDTITIRSITVQEAP